MTILTPIYAYQCILCCQPLFLMLLKFFQEERFSKQLDQTNNKLNDLVLMVKL